MTIKTDGRRERWVSKGQRMPGRCAPRFELRATNLRVEALPISHVKINRRNSRTHSAKQIRQIANSIVAFGFTKPIARD